MVDWFEDGLDYRGTVTGANGIVLETGLFRVTEALGGHGVHIGV